MTMHCILNYRLVVNHCFIKIAYFVVIFWAYVYLLSELRFPGFFAAALLIGDHMSKRKTCRMTECFIVMINSTLNLALV